MSKGRRKPDAPASRPPVSAREVALEALRSTSATSFAQERLDALIAAADLDRQEASLATELVLGVVRRRLTLDHVLARYLDRGLRKLQPGLPEALRIGAYQMLFLERIPPFAAVDSTVELIKNHVSRKAAGLANAVLRRVAELVGDATAVGPVASTRAVPLGAQRWRYLNEPALPDRQTHPAEHLSVAYSHPRGLIERWLARFDLEQTQQVCLAGVCRPPLVLRPNRRRITPKVLARRLTAEGVGAATVGQAGAVFVEGASPASRLGVIAEGLCQPQDATAQMVVRAAGVKPGLRVLDLCAAPGTKTTHLAELMNDDGLIVACDRTEEKLARIRENCARMDVTCVRTVLAEDIQKAIAEQAPFDLVLVDAPCSNTGVLARRPEARYRADRRSIAGLARIQAELLALGAGAVAPAGRLVYSTCSIEPEETELLVQTFLDDSGAWRLADIRLTLPSCGPAATDWRDGGFHAVMERSG